MRVLRGRGGGQIRPADNKNNAGGGDSTCSTGNVGGPSNDRYTIFAVAHAEQRVAEEQGAAADCAVARQRNSMRIGGDLIGVQYTRFVGD